jgi:hypothetical protein
MRWSRAMYLKGGGAFRYSNRDVFRTRINTFNLKHFKIAASFYPIKY